MKLEGMEMKILEESLRSRWKDGMWDKSSRRERAFVILRKYFKLYCRYSSLVGFKYIMEDRTTWFERILWILVYVIVTSTLIFALIEGYGDVFEHPIITTSSSMPREMEHLPFPGVAICTVNRISRQSAMEMATQVFNANITELKIGEILELISQLGDIYDTEYIKSDESRKIDGLLSKFYRNDYNILQILKSLTPQCSTMLLVCYFHGEKRNCSDIFAFRKTQDGYCCTFNYATKVDDNHTLSEEEEPVNVFDIKRLGITYGLSVVMEPLLNDYFYTLLPVLGWKVKIFNPGDYPDMTSGGVTEVLVSPKTEVVLNLDAVLVHSLDSIRPYSVSIRDCVFPEEMHSMGTPYTYSDCIVYCKLESAWESCGCTPVYLPSRESRKICGLEDMECVERHKHKWYNVIPHEDYEQRVENIHYPEVLRCKKCRPLCNDLIYMVKSWSFDATFSDEKFRDSEAMEIANQSILHVYFSSISAETLKQDVLYRWYELLADASGMCGIFVGFSLISVVELIYFTVLFFLELWGSPASVDNTRRDEILCARPPIQTIYWRELFPRTRFNGDRVQP